MKTLGLIILTVFGASLSFAQNKDTATVSISGYRLHAGTYSWRGTNTYFDRTPWDSSPFTEGHLRQFNGTYRQNFRLLYPNNYDANYSKGYPLMLVLHGAGERGNCWTKERGLECYYGNTTYNPNTQPVDATQDQINNLLNNDHNLAQGAGAHLSARNRAGTMYPDDPNLNERAFPGFVLYPQNLNGWTFTEVRDAIRTVRLLMKKLNIDPDRVYVSGLSNGGRGALFALVEADWLFAAAATQSAITDHTAYRTQIDSMVNIPLWMFQGTQDTWPTPGATKETIRVLNSAGGIGRYTEYPDLGHGTWNTAYAEPDYFSWFMSKNKSDIHVYFGNPNVCGTNDVGAKLSLPQGFLAYQWEKDGQIIQGATSEIYVANEPGVYRARFSRVSANPAENQWNNWSRPVNIGVQSPVKPVLSQVGSVVLRDLNGKNVATLQGPEGAVNYYWYKDNVLTTLPNRRTVQIQPGDCSGPCANAGQYTLITSGYENCPSQPSNQKGVFFNDQAPLTIPVPANFTGTLTNPTEVLLRWSDVSALERGYEIWRRKSTDNSGTGWAFVALTEENSILYTDKGLESNTVYWYKIRAVSNTARSNYAPGNSKVLESENLIISTGTDNTPPSPPNNFQAELSDTDIATKTASVQMKWEASTDETGVREYRIRYGTTTVSVPGNQTTHVLSALPLNKDFSFSVYAVDLAGNESVPSSPAQAKTYIDGFFWGHSTGGYTKMTDVPAKVWDKPEFRGRAANLTLEPRTQEDYFVFRYYGYVYVTTPGAYTFRMRSNDGVQLYLDGQLVARRNGLVGEGVCATTNFSSGIPPANLTEGIHTLEIRYFQYTGDKCLGIQWRGPDAGPNPTRFYDVPDTRIRSYPGYTPPVLPEIPENLAAQAEGMTIINLSWTYPGDDTVQFEIQRALSQDGPFTVINRITNLAYADTGLLPGTTYYYRLRSVNDAGVSDFTPVVNATTETDNEAPTAPTNLTLVDKTISTASLAWTASTDNTAVKEYEIWGNNVLLAKTQFNYHLLENLQPFTTYSVYVIAVDVNNNKSERSNTITFETIEPLVYFSKASGALNDLETWGTNADGSGESPSSFDLSQLYLNIVNRNTTSPGGVWNVQGANSRVIVNAGITFTANSAMQANLQAMDNSTIVMANAVMPTLVDLTPNTTVQYNNNVTQIQKTTYGNLVLLGSGSKTFQPGITKISRDFSVANGLGIKGISGNQSVIATSGKVTFLGNRTETPSNVTVGFLFESAGPQDLSATSDIDLFEISTGPGTNLTLNSADNVVNVKLGSNSGGGLSLASGSTFTAGKNTISLRGAATINDGNDETGKLLTDNAQLNIASSSNRSSNLYFDSAANRVNYLSVNMSGSGKAMIRNAVKITDGVKIVNGDFDANGMVTLLSDQTKTANLLEIENNGRVVNAMKVQRYVSPKLKTYRYMSSPVQGTTVADWQNYFAITGDFEGSSTGNGLTNSPSMYYYREPNWIAYPTTNNQAPIQRGVGYAVYVRNGEAMVMENSGVPHQGNIAFDITPPIAGNQDSGWNLLGNPYASTIEWSNEAGAWIRNNISSIVAVRNNFNATSGQFMYYDANTGLGTGNGGVLAGGRIAPAQAFYVQSTGPAPSLTITERAKSDGQQTMYRTEESPVSHMRLRLSQGDLEDVAIVAFTEFASDDFEPMIDGLKKQNIGMFNLSTLSGNNYSLAINNLSDGFCTKSVRVSVAGSPKGAYTISVDDVSSLVGVGTISLFDRYANKTVDLMQTTDYSFEIKDDPRSYAEDRFEIVAGRPAIESSIDVSVAGMCGENGRVTLASTQHGAYYVLKDQSGNVLAAEQGKGGQLDFTIPRDKLDHGANNLSVEGSFKGCDVVPITSNLVLYFEKAPIVLTNDASTCKGSTARLEASTDATDAQFIWFNDGGREIKGASGATYETAPIESETIYMVAAQLPSGCLGPKQIIIVTPEEVADPQISFAGDSLFTNSVASAYVWSRNGEQLAKTEVPYFKPNQDGEYFVTCITGGCQKTSAALEVKGIEAFPANGEFKVYPNPTTSEHIFVQAKLHGPGPAKVTISDALGRRLFSQEADAGSIETGLLLTPATRLKAGIYFLILEENSKSRKIKFMIKE